MWILPDDWNSFREFDGFDIEEFLIGFKLRDFWILNFFAGLRAKLSFEVNAMFH